MAEQPVAIAGRLVGGDEPCYVIAEAGVNHNGDPALVRELVRVAARSGADAVKFQTFTTERLVTATAEKARYQVEQTGGGESQADMLRRLELTGDLHAVAIEEARAAGITFFSTPFDEEAADFLESLDVPVFKIPSGDVTNLPLVRHIAAKRRPIILSTGMCSLREVAEALEAIEGAGPAPIILLHCLSYYPAPPEQANLRAMATMRAAFDIPVGFSDHTPGIAVPIAAATLGASVIEKHITTDRTLPGPDHAASLEPAELDEMVRSIRLVEASLGDGVKRRQPVEEEIARVARKSLVTTRAVAAGAAITRDAIAAKRPGTGIPPRELEAVVGRLAARDIPADTTLAYGDLV